MPDPPVTKKGRRTRQALVDAATAVFARKGLFDARVTDIVAEAGVSPAAFYRYFDTKSDILGEAVDNARDDLLRALRTDGRGRRDDSLFHRFAAANRRYFDAYRHIVPVMRMFEQRMAIDDSFRTVRRDWHPTFVGRLDRALRRMQARGDIDPALNVRFVAPALSAMVENLGHVNFVLRRRSRISPEVVGVVHMLWGNVLGLDWSDADVAAAQVVDGRAVADDSGAAEQVSEVEPSEPRVDRAQPLSRKGERTRAQLLTAARRVFEERGYLETRVADIVAAVDVAHGTFYNYFESRHDVFCALGEMLLDDLLVILDRSPPGPYSVRFDSATHVVEEIRLTDDFYRRNARFLAVLEQFASIDEEGARFRLHIRQVLVERVADALTELQRRGQVDERLPPAPTAEALVGMVDRSLFEWHVLGTEADPVAAAEHLPTVWLRAIGLGDPPPR